LNKITGGKLITAQPKCARMYPK